MQSLKLLSSDIHNNDILLAVPLSCGSCIIVYSDFTQMNCISNKPVPKRSMKTELNRSHHPISTISCQMSWLNILTLTSYSKKGEKSVCIPYNLTIFLQRHSFHLALEK